MQAPLQQQSHKLYCVQAEVNYNYELSHKHNEDLFKMVDSLT